MHTIFTSLILVLIAGFAFSNGLGPTSFYFLPLKSGLIDRDALAAYAPGGSVGVYTSDTKTVFSLTWEDCSIVITQQPNDIQALKTDYGKFIDLAPQELRDQIATSMQCGKLLKVEVSRAGFPTVIHSARQIIVCNKLHQLSGGFILTSQGFFQSDGRLICGESTAPANLFFSPPRQ